MAAVAYLRRPVPSLLPARWNETRLGAARQQVRCSRTHWRDVVMRRITAAVLGSSVCFPQSWIPSALNLLCARRHPVPSRRSLL